MIVVVFLLLLGSASFGLYYILKILWEVRQLRVDQTEILQRLEFMKRRMDGCRLATRLVRLSSVTLGRTR